MPDQFRYYLRVRYYECDAQKVVNNANYGNYAGVATTEFLRSLPGHDLLHGDLEYKVVKQELTWHAPAYSDEVLEITASVLQTARSSFIVANEFRRAGSEEVIARAVTIRHSVDVDTLEKKAIPFEVREALKKGAPGMVVDHAGYLASDDVFFC